MDVHTTARDTIENVFVSKGDVDIGLENAGAYLGDTFGPLMRVIWAVGLLAAGECYHVLSPSRLLM